jgi:hypothetical protein
MPAPPAATYNEDEPPTQVKFVEAGVALNLHEFQFTPSTEENTLPLRVPVIYVEFTYARLLKLKFEYKIPVAGFGSIKEVVHVSPLSRDTAVDVALKFVVEMIFVPSQHIKLVVIAPDNADQVVPFVDVVVPVPAVTTSLSPAHIILDGALVPMTLIATAADHVIPSEELMACVAGPAEVCASIVNCDPVHATSYAVYVVNAATVRAVHVIPSVDVATFNV